MASPNVSIIHRFHCTQYTTINAFGFIWTGTSQVVFNTSRCCIGCRSCFFVMMRSRRDSMTSLPHNWSQLCLSTSIMILTRQWVFTRVLMNHWYVCVCMWVSVCLCLHTCVSVCLCCMRLCIILSTCMYNPLPK